MTLEAQRRAAVLGGVGLALICGAIILRSAPLESSRGTLIGTYLIPAVAFLIGGALVVRSRFLRLLSVVKADRKRATDGQRAELAKLVVPMIGLMGLLLLGCGLIFAAPVADGRMGWRSGNAAMGLYLLGWALLFFVFLFGTITRLREIEILSKTR